MNPSPSRSGSGRRPDVIVRGAGIVGQTLALLLARDRLKVAGATVEIVSLQAGEIKGWDKKDWGRPVKVDKTLDEARASDYHALVLPGGQMNPDLLRVEPTALKFIKDIFDAKKPIAAVCHAPWLLIEAGIAGAVGRITRI